MTRERSAEVLETVADLREELAAAISAKVDRDTLEEVVGSVCGGLEEIGELFAPDHLPRFSPVVFITSGWDRRQ